MAMTISAFQNIVVRLANSRHTRYWLNWSGPAYAVMALQCVDDKGKPQKIADAESHGLTEAFDFVYTVRRTNDDGDLYIDSELEQVKGAPELPTIKGAFAQVGNAIFSRREQLLRDALACLYQETADYIAINHLGDTHCNQSMRKAREALNTP